MGKFKDLAIKKGNTERWASPTSTRELSSYVEEGNELIALFEGFKTYTMNGYVNVEYCDDNIRTIQDTHYHSSWDWLMPVVNKIEREHKSNFKIICNWNEFNECSYYQVIVNIEKGTMSKDKACIHDSKKVYEHATQTYECKKKATYNAVVEFIKWYNEQN